MNVLFSDFSSDMLHVVGDVHGDLVSYADALKEADAQKSIQLGDFSILKSDLSRREALLKERGLNPENHLFFGGNHDFYGESCEPYEEHALGHFGPVFEDAFFIRGAESVDKDRRIFGTTWFKEEELNFKQASNAIYLYEKLRPRVVFSHDAPQNVVNELFSPVWQSSTRDLLQRLFEIHQPELWFFGHFHDSLSCEFQGTQFRLLDILEVSSFDFSKANP